MSIMTKLSDMLSQRRTTGRQPLKGPFHRLAGNAWITHGAPGNGDNDDARFQSDVCVYEDTLRLTMAHQPIEAIAQGGEGRFSHWGGAILFSTSDGSDPNTNGRTYTYDRSLSLKEWESLRIKRATERWGWHPEGDRYLALGGDIVPPPLIANLGLTNKCNLRCEICGSQKYLDETGIRRRHMDYATFDAVASTLFPVLSQVELNSQGDPLLHPRIADILTAIESNRCEVKVQHNGTLLSDKIIELLLRQHGEIMLSLDAVGDRLDVVRSGANWQKAKPGLDRFLAERDPTRLAIGVYPTVTKRTLGDAIGIAEWALEKQIDHVVFHRYNPIQNSFEEAPSEAEHAALVESLSRWCETTGDQVWIQFEGKTLNREKPKDRRVVFPDMAKHIALVESGKVMFPTDEHAPGSDPFTLCVAPDEYVEIGLEGQISTCCRAQDVALGKATSVEGFAHSWFGDNYKLIRDSLRRGATDPLPLPNCAGCVQFFAPGSSCGREAIDYRAPANPGEARLKLASDAEIEVEGIQRETGFCHIAVFPVGLSASDYELFEDDVHLAPADSLHADIRTDGKGRHHIGKTELYFSASDNTDARRNGRRYTLRRIAKDRPRDLTTQRPPSSQAATGKTRLL